MAQSMNGVAEYNLTDGLGSVRQLTNAGGQVLLSQTFDPYGNRYQQARGSVLWDAASPFGWTGEQSDPNGLTYLRARYYAPSMGRFTQLDPFAGALALPASMNGYGYGHGNPVRYTDPSGKFVLTGLALVAAIVFIAGGTAFTIDYTMQYAENRARGMDVVQSLAYYNHDWGRTFGRTGEAMLMTTVGLAAGWAIGAAGLTGAAAWWVGGAVDMGFGTGWDMAVHGDHLGEALLWNTLFFGAGEIAGYGLKGAAKGLGRGGDAAFARLAMGAEANEIIARRLAYLEYEDIVVRSNRRYLDPSTVRWEYSGRPVAQLDVGNDEPSIQFFKRHLDAPDPRGIGIQGGRLQSHHSLQRAWAIENLSEYGYDPDLAPTVLLETGVGHPHTIISNRQTLRRDARIANGLGRWSSTLDDELGYTVTDFRAAGFSDTTIRRVLEQQYKMLDALEVLYNRVPGF